MNKKHLMYLLACSMLVAGCGAGDGGQSAEKTSGHVWSEQTDAIGKAKDVDQLIQQTADLQRQAIDEQSN